MATLNENAITKLTTETGICATAAGTTSLYTVPSGKKAAIDHLILESTTNTSSGTNAQVKVGGVSTYVDVLALSTAKCGTVAGHCFYAEGKKDPMTLQTSGGIIKLAIPSGGQVHEHQQKWTAHLFGHLIDE